MKIGIMISLFIFFNSVSSQLSSTQKSTMINLSNLLRNQTSSLRWNIRADPCSWVWVTCSNLNNISNSSVIELSLSNYGLTDSSFLALACEIQTLQALIVSINRLSSIPDEFFTSCGGLHGLRLVNFSSNEVSGFLPSFGNGFTELQSLDMSHNSLTGSIRAQLSGLVSLKSLNISFNNFTGSVPVNLSMALEQLQLSNNSFQGAIPEQLTEFENLTVLDLSSNQLSGELPSSIGELLKLEFLILSGNSLTGAVPHNILKITTLQRFAANLNFLTGEIPSGISNYVKNLDLSYNKLNGSIPDDLLSQPNLQLVDLSQNRLVGRIPANISSSLFRLRVGGNSLKGSISAISFHKLKNLQYLELENNLFSGEIPADLGTCQKLRLLNLAGNRFSGNIPPEMGNLKNLTVLSLQLNNFLGNIPQEITQLSSLSTLNISWNSLTGEIPPAIANLTKLASLHLQGNNLRGAIPKSIGNLNYLLELQLGKNYLSGNIDSLPRSLQYALNLSHNLFQGTIPESLGQLTSLQILDLSHNRFSGKIPDFLPELQSLTLLLLDYNNLSGERPQFRPNLVVDTRENDGLLIPESSPASNPFSSHRKLSIAVKFAVITGAILFGGLVAILAVSISRRVLCKVHDRDLQTNGEDHPLPQATESHMLTTNSAHRANMDFSTAMAAVANPLNLVLATKFSTYYKVNMPSGKTYLIKKLNYSDRLTQQDGHEKFGKELEALGKLNSSNIMTPLAYVLAADSAYLLYESAFMGTLFDVLHRNSGIPLDWVSRCSVAVGVAQGLASLHGCSSGPVLLFDLSSKTVMLKSLREPQIGDIELFRVIDPSKSTSSLSAVAGSVGYIPPEYAYTMRVTMAGNVYSFGVILLELLTGKQAVTEGTEMAKWVRNNSTHPQRWDRMLDFSVSRTSPAVKSQMLAVLKIAVACINPSSEARPKMKTVLRMLLNAK